MRNTCLWFPGSSEYVQRRQSPILSQTATDHNRNQASTDTSQVYKKRIPFEQIQPDKIILSEKGKQDFESPYKNKF